MSLSPLTCYANQTGYHQDLLDTMLDVLSMTDESPAGAPLHLLNSLWSLYQAWHGQDTEHLAECLSDALATLSLDLIHERLHPESFGQFCEDIEALEDMSEAVFHYLATGQRHDLCHVGGEHEMTPSAQGIPEQGLPSGFSDSLERLMDVALIHCRRAEDPRRIVH